MFRLEFRVYAARWEMWSEPPNGRTPNGVAPEFALRGQHNLWRDSQTHDRCERALTEIEGNQLRGAHLDIRSLYAPSLSPRGRRRFFFERQNRPQEVFPFQNGQGLHLFE